MDSIHDGKGRGRDTVHPRDATGRRTAGQGRENQRATSACAHSPDGPADNGFDFIVAIRETGYAKVKCFARALITDAHPLRLIRESHPDRKEAFTNAAFFLG